MGTLFVLKESQVKKIIDKLIQEQQYQYVDHFGSTSAVRVTHGKLTTEFGLPNGAKYENYYYKTTTDKILEISKNGIKENLLSVFQPYKKYTNENIDYVDYFSINNDSIINRGSKKYYLRRGDTVIAAHNGLLTIGRAMINMEGVEGYLTINFGVETKNENVDLEMISRNIIMNSDKFLNINKTLNMIQAYFCKYAINPRYYSKMAFDGTGGANMIELPLDYINRIIYKLIIGLNNYLNINNNKMVDDMIKELMKKGLKTTIDFDITPVINNMKNFSSIPDFDMVSNTFNEEKKLKLQEYGKKYEKNLADAIKSAYVQNFNLFVETYLPKYEEDLKNKIKTLNVVLPNVGNIYNREFYSTPGRTIPEKPSSGNVVSGQYKPGS